jgi:hypothetical protein
MVRPAERRDLFGGKIWKYLLHAVAISLWNRALSIVHMTLIRAADRNVALTTSVYGLKRFGSLRTRRRMRNRDKMFQMSPAARSIGRGLGMSAACLIAGIATAQAQSASNENSEIERFPLRGTTTSTPQSTSPYRASTLYGALPVNRDTTGDGQQDEELGGFDSTATANSTQPPQTTGSVPTDEEGRTGRSGFRRQPGAPESSHRKH